MTLDDRKLKILHAIIRNYLETGEPVGSRTISKYTDLNLSSATIRNEMSDLEEMGFIVQPHTSAGRIPSDKGYRLYVDSMMEIKDKGEVVRIYTTGNEKTVTQFIMTASEYDGFTFICLDGTMSRADLEKAIAKATQNME